MKSKIFLLVAATCITMLERLSAQNIFGEISGVIKDEEGNPVPGAIISYTRNGNLQGTSADENGRYRLKPLDAGFYDLSISFLGFRNDTIKKVSVSAGQITVLDYILANSTTLPPVDIVYHQGLFEKDQTMTVQRLNTEDIERSPETSIMQMVATTPAVYLSERGDDKPNVRGSRSDATQYYVDGIKMIGSFFIPKSAIKEISVITGGLPAMFGDATGGVVVITTKSCWDR
jgi:hypothetical protein